MSRSKLFDRTRSAHLIGNTQIPFVNHGFPGEKRPWMRGLANGNQHITLIQHHPLLKRSRCTREKQIMHSRLQRHEFRERRMRAAKCKKATIFSHSRTRLHSRYPGRTRFDYPVDNQPREMLLACGPHPEPDKPRKSDRRERIHTVCRLGHVSIPVPGRRCTTACSARPSSLTPHWQPARIPWSPSAPLSGPAP